MLCTYVVRLLVFVQKVVNVLLNKIFLQKITNCPVKVSNSSIDGENAVHIILNLVILNGEL